MKTTYLRYEAKDNMYIKFTLVMEDGTVHNANILCLLLNLVAMAFAFNGYWVTTGIILCLSLYSHRSMQKALGNW